MHHSYCRNCLREAPEGICPHCGFDPELEPNNPDYPETDILNGRYLTGRILSRNESEVLSLGLDLAEDRKVCIREVTAETSLPAGVTIYDTFREHGKIYLISAPDQLIFPPIPKLRKEQQEPEAPKRSLLLPLILILLIGAVIVSYVYLFLHPPVPRWFRTPYFNQSQVLTEPHPLQYP